MEPVRRQQAPASRAPTPQPNPRNHSLFGSRRRWRFRLLLRFLLFCLRRLFLRRLLLCCFGFGFVLVGRLGIFFRDIPVFHLDDRCLGAHVDGRRCRDT